MRLTSRALLSLIVLVAFTGTMLAAPSGAPLLSSATGTTVNEARALNSSSLHVGDLVTTDANGSAVLTLDAARVDLGTLTAARVETGALSVNHGYVRVNGALTLHDGHVIALPTAKTDFDLAVLANGRSYLHVYSGSVELTGLSKPMTVPAGASASFEAAGGSAAQAVAGAGYWWLVGIGIVAAGTAGAVWYATSQGPAATPTQPNL